MTTTVMTRAAGSGATTPTSTARTVGTIAVLTLREASRRRVVLALVALTAVLLALSSWGFSRLAAESGGSALTSGEARLTASIVLNLVMFGLSLVAALGTAFLAGPTLAGETESGIALSVLARPVRRSAYLLGKWLGLVGFGSGFVVVAGLAQCLVVRATTDYWPPAPATALALLAAQTTVLLTLALLLSTAVSPMASGVVSVGLFCTTWVAGVVGGVGASLGNESVERVGTVSRVLLPTDGLWRGAMHAFQDPSALLQFGDEGGQAFPFLSVAPLSGGYLAWAAVWVLMVGGLAASSFVRKDLQPAAATRSSSSSTASSTTSARVWLTAWPAPGTTTSRAAGPRSSAMRRECPARVRRSSSPTTSETGSP
jgi:ABC-type transport system involved in multi-copper enzyme maturation permease subunit